VSRRDAYIRPAYEFATPERLAAVLRNVRYEDGHALFNGAPTRSGYPVAKVNRKTAYVHHLAWFARYGSWDDGDHVLIGVCPERMCVDTDHYACVGRADVAGMPRHGWSRSEAMKATWATATEEDRLRRIGPWMSGAGRSAYTRRLWRSAYEHYGATGEAILPMLWADKGACVSGHNEALSGLPE
jgi:hypothetical protein